MSTDEHAITPWEQIEPPTVELDDEPAAGAVQPPVEMTAPIPLPEDEKAEPSDDLPIEGEEDLVTTGGGGLWSIPLICAGIALIAACLIIPAADENHRLVYERERLNADLEQIHKQVEVNDEFLKRLNDDSRLLERLAQRQMKMVREGTSVLELKEQTKSRGMSPYGLVNVPAPAPMPAYQPIGGKLSSICRNPRYNLYLTGGGLLMIAAGLVASMSSKAEEN